MHSSKKTSKSLSDSLFKIASLQQGFFTTKQAKAAGHKGTNFLYYIRVGHWTREGRALYRLAQYPLPQRPGLMRWALWSRGRNDIPQGVYSHETALSLHDLSDVMPAKFHMTVPSSFRRNTPIPAVIALHKGRLNPKDIQTMEGVPVTTPLRTIVDVMKEGVLSQDLVEQSILRASALGLISDRTKSDMWRLSGKHYKRGYEQIKKRVIEATKIDEKEMAKPGKLKKQGRTLRAIIGYMSFYYGNEKIIDMAERFKITRQSMGALVNIGREIVEGDSLLKQALLK